MRFCLRLLLCAALGLWAYPSFAQDDICAPYPDVSVNITTHFDDPTYDFSQDINSILGLAHDSAHSIREGLTLGLTRYNPLLKFRVSIREIKRSDGIACASVDHVDVDIGYTDVIVYIASEIPQDSCGFNEVMAHEQKHIDVNKRILDEYTPRIESELKDYLHLNGSFAQLKEDYGMVVLHDKLQKLLTGIAEDMTQENQRRQQAIDTRAEYERVSAACGGQLRGVASRFFERR